MTDSRLSPAAWRSLLTNSSICFSGTITLLVTLPASAGAAASRTATAEAAEATATTTTSATKTAAAPSSSAAAAGKQHPEQQRPTERSGDQEQENDDSDNPRCYRKLWAEVIVWRSAGRLRVGNLNPGILCDHIRDAGCDQGNCAAVVALLEKRHGFASEATYFAVGQNPLKPIPDRSPILVVLHRVEDQHTTITALLADSPLLVKLHGVIERIIAV